jgi:hypothetical protein
MISAPHAINQYREGKVKMADRTTGGIAMYLHEITGCHIVYSAHYSDTDPNYDSHEGAGNQYQTDLRAYIEKHNIKFLIDLHGAAMEKEYAVELGTAPKRDMLGEVVGDENRSLKRYAFIAKFIRFVFEHELADVEASIPKEVWQNRIFDAGSQNTVTRYISENTDCACTQLEINGFYRDFEHPAELRKMLAGLTYIIRTLGHINWDADRFEVFRLWHSGKFKPQDMVELTPDGIKCFGSKPNGLLSICSDSAISQVRLHEACRKTVDDFRHSPLPHAHGGEQEYLFLTNRLIESLFQQVGIQGSENHPFIGGKPIVVYEERGTSYPIGVPLADRIDRIRFSSALYEALAVDSNNYEFAVYNRYTDAQLYIDFDKADYHDCGRVNNRSGNPAKRVMIPRYYRHLLGYMKNEPLLRIREEEFLLLQSRVNEYVTDLSSKQMSCADITNVLNECYEQIRGEAFYQLKEDVPTQTLADVNELLRAMGVYDSVEVLRIPKMRRVDGKWSRCLNAVKGFLKQTVVKILNLYIGKEEYALRAEWSNDTDDKNNVARLSHNMMKLVGVSENDKIMVKYGAREVTLRVLADNNLSDFVISVPAPTRKKLGMNSVNSIVAVSRNMRHAFRRHSQEQTIAIIGIILAVFQVAKGVSGLIWCLVLTPVVLYFALKEERIKVK